MPSMLHPFDPARNKPRANQDGSYSTEITRTVQLPDGSWANVPSLWWADGNTVRDFGTMSDDQLAGFAMRYEHASGQQFPRFRDISEAEAAAKNRSNAGGGTQGQISQTPGALGLFAVPPPPVPTLGRTLGATPPLPPLPRPRPKGF